MLYSKQFGFSKIKKAPDYLRDFFFIFLNTGILFF